MSSIYDLLAQIQNAVYGKDVRDAIHDSIEQCYKDATGNPDSLAAIFEKLFNGSIAGIGDIVEGDTEWGTEISVTPNTTTELNSVYLKPGTWLLFYNVLFASGVNDSANPYEIWCSISPADSPSGIPMNYSTSFNTDPSDLGTSYSGFFAATVTEEDATITDSDPDKDGTDLYHLYTRHSGLLAASATSKLIAIKIKSNSDGESVNLEEQVAQNTADISLLNEEVTDVKSDLGNLDDLETTDKSTLVAAINEAAQSGGGGGGSGLTAALKAALDQLAQKVAYIDEDGQDYYDALHNALYPPADLVSISAVYTQSGTVYGTDTLDSLKDDLVVTAHF